MIKIFTRVLPLFWLLGVCENLTGQGIITQWNFNSITPDAANATGSANPSVGSGSITNIGGTVASFATGSAGSDSSDPAASDNTAWGLTGWPEQGLHNKTAGIRFAASTAGHQNIMVTFDLRHSNTGPRHSQFQYTKDVTAESPVWVDFAVDGATSGDTWFNRSYNLSGISKQC